MDSSSVNVKPKNNGTKQIFQNPILEALSRTHIAVPIGMFAAFAIGLFGYGLRNTPLGWGWLLGLTVLGLLVFTFVEYVVHRYLFHIMPDTPAKATFQYRAHGVHHEYPKDKTRLAMPPLISALLATGVAGLGYLALGNFAFGFMPGFFLGYAAYLFVHYAVHAFRPPQNFLKVLWVNHGIHHYKDHDIAFGVSSPLWDWVFGTLPKTPR